MSGLYRRRFLSGLATSLFTPILPFTGLAEGLTEQTHVRHQEFLHGRAIAREERTGLTDSGYSLVDFWTFRVSEIETSCLPANVSRVVVWDEVFDHRLTKREKMVRSISTFYDFEPADAPNTLGLHIDGTTSLDRVISNSLLPRPNMGARPRIALVDIPSCGLSRLEWHHIIPHLRTHYDLVVGFVHHPGSGRDDWNQGFNDQCSISANRMAMRLCNYLFETSDLLLGFDDVLDCDERRSPLNSLVHDLADWLSSPDFREAVRSKACPPRCAVAHVANSLDGPQN